MQNYLDMQLLLYTPADRFDVCRDFYEGLLGLTAFYGWDDAPDDRGLKYHVGGGVLVVLAQEHPFEHEAGVTNYQVEVGDVEALYARFREQAPEAITYSLFTRPYGWRMFRAVDPAGNHINFYQIPKD